MMFLTSAEVIDSWKRIGMYSGCFDVRWLVMADDVW